MPEKICEVCNAKIGETDTVCPACGADLETLEQEIESVVRATKVIEKRRKAAEPPQPPPPPAPPKKKLTIFQALALKKKENK